ncbi:MAG TPA: ECF-type sigma factor [Phycisphaerae bacterium]|nr:ECF-type sigma factor [Phycisphaerae bacterium]
MSDVTQILQAMDRGDAAAASELLPLVYEELRRLAASKLATERPDHTLQPTALVHEAFLRLVGSPIHTFQGRGHFLAAAAEGMRRILVEYARSRNALKRGKGRKVQLEWASVATVADLLPEEKSDEILALDDALLRLEKEDPGAAKLVRLRFFADLSIDETADVLGISPRSVNREWAFARTRLLQMLRGKSM